MGYGLNMGQDSICFLALVFTKSNKGAMAAFWGLFY